MRGPDGQRRIVMTPALGYLTDSVAAAERHYGSALSVEAAYLTGAQLMLSLAHENPAAAEQLRGEMRRLHTMVLGLAGMVASERWHDEVVAELLAKLGEET